MWRAAPDSPEHAGPVSSEQGEAVVAEAAAALRISPAAAGTRLVHTWWAHAHALADAVTNLPDPAAAAVEAAVLPKVTGGTVTGVRRAAAAAVIAGRTYPRQLPDLRQLE